LEHTQTDIVWIRDPRDLPLCSLAIRNSGAELVFHQGMQISQPKTKPWHRVRYKRVSRWIAPLRHLRDEALANTTLRPEQIEVIPLALEANWFSTPKSPEARAMWSPPADAKIVGLFGRIDPLKGHDTLIRALAEAAPAWHALIIGENTPNAGQDFRSECRALAESLGVTDRVHWHQPTEELLSAYDACDAYAMCSTSETFGMVTIEALARRVPVVGTDAGGTPELLGHGTHGTLFKPGDWKALADALQRLDTLPIVSDAHVQRFTKEHALKRWSETLAAIRASAS
jgi:glycosyltransferase involved in cell wall biosynthesis